MDALTPLVLRFPNEMFIMIFEYLKSPPDLLSVVLACKNFSRLARLILYRDISAPSANISRLSSLLTTLSGDGALARRVKRFQVVLAPIQTWYFQLELIRTDTVHFLGRTLLALENLVELEIGLPIGKHYSIPWDALVSSQCRLRTFKLHNGVTNVWALLEFLSKQDEITDFEWHKAPDHLTFSTHTSVLPRLRRFVGNAETAYGLFHSSDRLPDDMTIMDIASTNRLSWLAQMHGRTIQHLTINVTFIRTLFRAFPSEVTCVRALTVNFARQPGVLFLSNPWFRGISLFKNLHSFALEGTLLDATYEPALHLSTRYGLPTVVRTEEIYLELIATMHGACTTLDEISLPRIGKPNIVFRRVGKHWPRP